MCVRVWSVTKKVDMPGMPCGNDRRQWPGGQYSPDKSSYENYDENQRQDNRWDQRSGYERRPQGSRYERQYESRYDSRPSPRYDSPRQDRQHNGYRQKDPYTSQRRRQVTCYSCGKEGHEQRDCPNFVAKVSDSIDDLSSAIHAPDWDVLLENLPPIKKKFNDGGEVSEELHSELMEENRISYKGKNIPAPIDSFNASFISSHLREILADKGFTRPMPIQMAAIPIILAGRDMVGIAQTGSGKTLAFTIPAMIHIAAQVALKPLRTADGPLALVLAPTRELAIQIKEEGEKLKGDFEVAAVFGGQRRMPGANVAITQPTHMIAATPGRLLDYVLTKKISLNRVSYFVLDEADRMLDMGFQPQVQAIVGQARPDRQSVFFSATWPTEVRELVNQFSVQHNDIVQVNVGREEVQANHSIEQVLEVFDWNAADYEKKKKARLIEVINTALEEENPAITPKILIFVNTKSFADELSWQLYNDNIWADAMHSNLKQEDRIAKVEKFKTGKIQILVSTNVLGRGIDIPGISHVIVYDFPGHVEDYIHCIGRTARGVSALGKAFCFYELNEKSLDVPSQLIDQLTNAKQNVPESLIEVAAKAEKLKEEEWQPRTRRW